MRVPTDASWSGVSPLTVAWVPTGMKTGVSTGPCGVASNPVRAAPSRRRTWKETAMKTRPGPALKPGGERVVEVQAAEVPFHLVRGDGQQDTDLLDHVLGEPVGQVPPNVSVPVGE